MFISRFSLPALLAVALLAGGRVESQTVPGVGAIPMPGLDAAITNSSPEQAQRGMSNHTWFWHPGNGPAQIHYSAPEGRDFV